MHISWSQLEAGSADLRPVWGRLKNQEEELHGMESAGTAPAVGPAHLRLHEPQGMGCSRW